MPLCKHCGTEFPRSKGPKLYCSRKCQEAKYKWTPESVGRRTTFTVACINCGVQFERVWPNTKQTACSRACSLAVYRDKNREYLTQKSADWAKNNREARLAIQRKWNNSDKGVHSKRKYYEKNLSEICKKYLERYHTDEMVKKLQLSRANSRKLLIRSGRKRVCEMCGSDKRLQCHHQDHNPLNRELSNLKWLCTGCHNLVHSETGLVEKGFVVDAARNTAI